MTRAGMWSTFVAAASLLGLLNCGGAERGQPARADTAATRAGEARPARQDTPVAVAGKKAERDTTDGEGRNAVDFSLVSEGTTGIAGRGRLHLHGEELHVPLRLTGVEPGRTYPAHIHHGTCDAGGPIAVPLTPVEASDSAGTSQTVFPADSLTAGEPYFVQAHLPGGEAAACADVSVPRGGGSHHGGHGSG